MSDPFGRVMLTLITVALCLICAEQLGWIHGASDQSSRATLNAARFRLVPLGPARRVLLLDGETGAVWYAPFNKPNTFVPVERLDHPGSGDEPDEGTPKPAEG